MTLGHLKPAVPKCWLFIAGGVMWSVVGLMMGATGIGWLVPEGPLRGAGYGLVGMVLAVGMLRWRFNRMAQKNIRRLRKLPARGCFFAFQAWQSYLIILSMIALGFTLRQLPIRRTILAVVYMAIGGALFWGSFHYYRHLARLARAAAHRPVSGSSRRV